MKHFFTKNLSLLLFFSFFISTSFSQGSGGIYESFLILNRGAGNEFFDLDANTGNPDFTGSIGTFNSGQTLSLKGFEQKVFKCGTLNITSGAVLYTIYPSGGTPGTFIGVSFTSAFNISGAGDGCQNQQWQTNNANINLLSGLCDGDYVLEVFTTAAFEDGSNLGTIFSNNGGANYKATFTVKNDNLSDIYESYLILNTYGQGNQFYDLKANTDNPNFDGANLGEYCNSGTLVLSGAENKVFKCGTNDITDGKLYYRIYPSGGTGGSFSEIDLPYDSPLDAAPGCVNQKWQKSDAAVNLLADLIPGDYVLEVYTQASYTYAGAACGGIHYANNSPNNYKATFKVCSPKSSAFNESYVIINKGSFNEFYDLQSTTLNPDFEGADLGTFNGSQTFKLNGAENKTTECTPDDILDGKLYYRIYPEGSTPSSFNLPVNLPVVSESLTNCNEQTWREVAADIDLLVDLCDGKYVLEVYTSSDYTDNTGSKTYNFDNGGKNYKATFTVKNDDQSGIFESYIILDTANTGNKFYDLQAPSASTNSDFDGLDLGDFCDGKTLNLSGAQNKTFKCGINDILNGALYYRIYPSTSSPTGSFTKLNLGFSSENTSPENSACLDQVWETSDATVDLLAGLDPGAYTLEVYTQADYNYGICSSVHYTNNSTANYKASFSVCIASLPVTYSKFNGIRRGRDVELSWKTATEINTARFEVERKTNGRFEKIGTVSATGNAIGGSYNFTDVNNQFKGISQYRIKSVAKNNESKYSKVVALNYQASGLQIINVVPTLVEKSNVVMNVSSDKSMKIELQLTDISGKQMQRTSHQLMAGSNQLSIDASRLAPGTYFVTAYSSEGKSSVHRFVKR